MYAGRCCDGSKLIFKLRPYAFIWQLDVDGFPFHSVSRSSTANARELQFHFAMHSPQGACVLWMSFGLANGRDLWANAQKRSLKTHFPFGPITPPHLLCTLRIANSIKHYIIWPRPIPTHIQVAWL